jgi:hypothetical protein
LLSKETKYAFRKNRLINITCTVNGALIIQYTVIHYGCLGGLEPAEFSDF